MPVFISPFTTRGFLLLASCGCFMTSSVADSNGRIDSEPLDCDASSRCPKWMFCDERSDPRLCHSCSVCTFYASERHVQCTESIARCSHATTTDTRLVCGDMEVIPGAQCSGLCRPQRRIPSGFPVGTECTIQCPEVNTSISCQWNTSATRANWNASLPPGVRIRSPPTSSVEPSQRQISTIPTVGYSSDSKSVGMNSSSHISPPASVNAALLVVIAIGLSLGLVTVIAVVAATVTCHRHRLKSTLQQIQHKPNTVTVRKASACENSEDDASSEEASSNDIDENMDSLLTTVDTHRHAPPAVEHSETEEEITSGIGSTSIMLVPDNYSEYCPRRIDDCEEQSCFLLSSTEDVRPSSVCRHNNHSSSQLVFSDTHSISETACKQA